MPILNWGSLLSSWKALPPNSVRIARVFIRNEPARVTGRGEHISPIDLDLEGWHIAMIHPGIHVPTSTGPFNGSFPNPIVQV